MIQRHALALCESCDGCGTTEGDLRNRDCQDCLGTGYAEPQKRILNLQSELSQTRHELDSWAKQCDANMRLLKQAFDAGEEAIKQRDTLAEALGYLMQSCESIDCEAMMPAAMPFAYIKAKQALAAVKGGSND